MSVAQEAESRKSRQWQTRQVPLRAVHSLMLTLPPIGQAQLVPVCDQSDATPLVSLSEGGEVGMTALSCCLKDSSGTGSADVVFDTWSRDFGRLDALLSLSLSAEDGSVGDGSESPKRRFICGRVSLTQGTRTGSAKVTFDTWYRDLGRLDALLSLSLSVEDAMVGEGSPKRRFI